ncbi:YiiX/YebB-like N1pC/P60 family cysteine hydrolase [Chromatocurvus halotolerans]|uniref:Permuted papain-like amidase YaeF/Yiix C92 family enzyme n=1 Tax=Chromatocurvus halotolerans TaxID=1132028 RepID=A0A4R2KV97_9GAMM|nr:YiiX/YebB-like N1pC/P60 family cysteine hydrolase [Chromatocurvus halotolerans]TCO77743.1 permuted papain-like amidase YaeF/Yiix C92 family enzyme [Chromatocurvus halotolerans]
MNSLLHRIGTRLAEFLSKPRGKGEDFRGPGVEALLNALEPGDVLLVEGTSRISTAIRYLTQSTWSHAALYIGFGHDRGDIPDAHCFIEADTRAGVRTTGISEYAGFNTRICRPVGVSNEDRRRVIDHALGRLGHQYDLRNITDLARYLLPTPPVPSQFRRRMISLGSGDPTRAICSTLIAEAFQSIRYPILPFIGQDSVDDGRTLEVLLYRRHHTLFVPRDFDLSPYFDIIKPTLHENFNFRRLKWVESELPEKERQAL